MANWTLKNFHYEQFLMLFWTILDRICASDLKNKGDSSKNQQNDSNVFKILSLGWIQNIMLI